MKFEITRTNKMSISKKKRINTTMDNFRLSSLALFVSANLAVCGASHASNFVDQLHQSELNQSEQYKSTVGTNFSSSKRTLSGIAKGHFLKVNGQSESKIASFNWNTGKIAAKPLNYNMPLKPQYQAAMNDYFKLVASQHGANKVDLTDSALVQFHDTGVGGLIGRYQQKIDGVEVFGRSINLLMNRKNQLLASSGYFATVKKLPQTQYSVSQERAMSTAFASTIGEIPSEKKTSQSAINQKVAELNTHSFQFKTTKSGYSKLQSSLSTGGSKLTTNSRVKNVYFPVGNNSVVPAYYVEAEVQAEGSRQTELYSYVIDGISGKVLFKNNMTAHVENTYRVFADPTTKIPFDGPQGDALTPHPTGEINDTPAVGSTFVSTQLVSLDNAGISTNDPWLTGAQTTTSGNNVDAYADISGEDGFDATDVRASASGANTFDYEFGSFNAGLSGDPQQHAIVNLFYVNNFLHDWFYDSGFDEAAGNAQVDNFGRGGQGGDALLAEAQDSSGVNNANMSTPADGGSPRMQMFLWDFLSNALVEINGISNIETLAASFGPSDFDVSGVMSLVDDGTDPIGNGCEAITTDLTGLVAIIDRGDCNFTVKVKNAQNQGAVGVIMVNNVTGGVITQGGDDATVTIPSMMVSMEKGDEIKAALLADNTLQARLANEPQPIDGTLDNSIVAHEWAHYLSNRLVGNGNGLSNNQGRSMGEGWSDFVALLLSVKESDSLIAGNETYQGVYAASTFVGNAYYGIRRAPYTTDMTKNALTFKHIEDGVGLTVTHPIAFGASGASNSEVHATGEIWANVLWESYAGLINKPGYSFSQAQDAMKNYLVASLKMTPNAPTLLEARDALLSVALANDAEDFAIIRDAFSKRGMGATAVAPDRGSASHRGVVEDFTQGVDLTAAIALDSASLLANTCDNDGVLDIGESANFNLSFSNFAGGSIPSFNVNLSSDDSVTFSNSTVTIPAMAAFGDTATASFSMTLDAATMQQQVNITATLAEIGASTGDFIEPGPIAIGLSAHFDFQAAQNSDDMANSIISSHDWEQSSDDGVTKFSAENSEWYGVDSGAPGNAYLTTPVITGAASGDVSIDFDHYYTFESSEDANGVLKHWDAGVIEVSVDGAAFVDVVDFGATLAEAYNGTVESFNAALGGRNAYVDTNGSSLSANSVTFPDGLVNGKNFQVRFRIGTDANTGEDGWHIDNVVVNNASNLIFSEIVADSLSCASGTAPTVTAQGGTVSEGSSFTLTATGTDAENDPLTYNWTQTAGPTVTLSDSTAANPSFTAPQVNQNTTLSFEVTVSDGVFTSAAATADVTVTNVAEPEPPQESSGGGSMPLGLLLLGGFGLFASKKRKSC